MRIIRWITIAIFIGLTVSGCGMLDKLAQKNMYPAPDNGSTKTLGVYPNEEGPVLFYLHGNGTNIKSLEGGFTDKLRSYGHLIIPEYPGYGPVEGVPSEKTIVDRTREELTAVRDAFPDRKIVIIGRSLGAAVATQLADGSTTDLLLISPWTSAKDAAKASPLAKLVDRVSDEFWDANKWDTLSKAKTLHVNALVIHGDIDKLIPVDQGILVSNALAAEQEIIIGAGHNDIFPHIWGPVETFTQGDYND